MNVQKTTLGRRIHSVWLGMGAGVMAATLVLGLHGSLSASAAEPDRGGGDSAQDYAGSTFAHEGSALAHDGISQELRQRKRSTRSFNYVRGHDVSGWQESVNWSDAASKGARFVYIKATEDDDYVSSQYEKQWKGAGDTGFYRGSYHFGRPFWSDGTSQADHFMKTIHAWKPAQRLLPPMLDLEHRCSDLTKQWAIHKCEAMTPAKIVKWIHDFVSVVEERTGGVKPVIYTNPSWWKKYTGDTKDFKSYPLFIANWLPDVSGGPGALPGGWADWTLWQHWDNASGYVGPGSLLPGDQDLFHGTRLALKRFSNNVPYPSR